MEYIFYIILAVFVIMVVSGVVAMLIITKPIGVKVYHDQLVRTGPEKWGRACSEPSNEEQFSMWNAGIDWANAHKDVMEEVEIENDGLKLYGEYYNFGGDRCVIILPGRCESLMYSYYFALPYEKMGMNVLVIDQRAHGNSDGKYSTIGVKESQDVLKWIELIENKYSIKEIWFHGICVGTATALLVMTGKNCPVSVKGLVTEGCFVSFRETFKTHMMDIKKPWFPVLDLVMMNVKKYAGANVYKAAPILHVGKVKQHILMIYGKQDIFSLPKKSIKLFNKCKSPTKEIVWFDKGGHSHLRINNTDAYDDAIIDYVTRMSE